MISLMKVYPKSRPVMRRNKNFLQCERDVNGREVAAQREFGLAYALASRPKRGSAQRQTMTPTAGGATPAAHFWRTAFFGGGF